MIKRLDYPDKVTFHDTTVRDGFQREERLIPTGVKLSVVEKLVMAGFKSIEVTNFAHPKRLPQFADAEELLRNIRSHRPIEHLLASVELTAVTINQAAVERAVAACRSGMGPDRILLLVSLSDAYQKTNSGMTISDYWKMAETCIMKARDAGLKVCGAINSIWGCPMAGPTDMRSAVEFARRWLDIGAHDVEHADHDGCGSPDRVYDYFARILDVIPDPAIHIAHFHSTRGWGAASVLAALQAGITHYETTMGGIGGQPANLVDGLPVAGTGDYYHKEAGLSGLISTEDMAVMMDEMGIDTGLDIDAVLKIGAMTERIIGRRLRSECVHTGRIPKAGTSVREVGAGSYSI